MKTYDSSSTITAYVQKRDNGMIINHEGMATSEGKLLEIIPVITDPYGQPFTLPPVVYHVPNELMGYYDDRPMAMPQQFFMGERISIQGSNAALNVRVTFLVRLLEASPSAGIDVATVDIDAVKALIDAIKAGSTQAPSPPSQPWRRWS